ncbi:MAG: hypothetical protein LC135_07985 [Phycisphaerae bacterium]|nr:hypothetical protein [Phycisphaerae bacterium]MCZ2399793.1 hypothetical protein [Phycisphaerae bacterium]NUQ49014.1 hypothetical protein [Phycisphaerae bacterium]
MSHQPHDDAPVRPAPPEVRIRPASPAPADPRSSEGKTPPGDRVVELLEEIRGRLDADARDRAHKPFSLAWLLGGLLQVLVVGLVVLAALDWLFQTGAAPLLTKLAFAITLQLMALTAFVLARDDRA